MWSKDLVGLKWCQPWNECELIKYFLIAEWAHHSDYDREPWDWQPEEERRRCQDEAGDRDKGRIKLWFYPWPRIKVADETILLINTIANSFWCFFMEWMCSWGNKLPQSWGPWRLNLPRRKASRLTSDPRPLWALETPHGTDHKFKTPPCSSPYTGMSLDCCLCFTLLRKTLLGHGFMRWIENVEFV